MLHRLTEIPDGLLDRDAAELAAVLPSATLLSLSGERPEPLFLSVLLHGNETTGWIVAREILARYRAAGLPRSLLLFIGNVTAAAQGKRRLDGQPDYNRIWLPGDTNEHHMVEALLAGMATESLFASIDIHNNTGINPHYACLNRLDNRFINLARTFSRTIIYFVQPASVQSNAFARFCPAVTLECGRVGDQIGIQLATAFVDEVLNLDAIPDTAVNDTDIDLFHTTAVVRIPEQVSFCFDDGDADLRFIPGIETLNFEEIPPGTCLAGLSGTLGESLEVVDEQGRDIVASLFAVEDGKLVNRRPWMPAMLTMDEKVIRQDCLCYVMERYRIAMGEKDPAHGQPVWSSC